MKWRKIKECEWLLNNEIREREKWPNKNLKRQWMKSYKATSK